MAKKKKGRKRQGWFSKAINIGGVLIGLSGIVIEPLVASGFTTAALKSMLRRLTFGLSEGTFNLDAGLRGYGPVGAAVGYRELTKYLMRHFPVR